MKRNVTCLVIVMLLLTTVFSVAVPTNAYTMTTSNSIQIENTTAPPGMVGHVIQIQGIWTQGILATNIVVMFNPSKIDITEINLDGCIGENNNVGFSYEEIYAGYIWATIQYFEQDLLPPGQGTLFNIVCTISPAVPIGEIIPLTFDYESAYYDENWQEIPTNAIGGQIEIMSNQPPNAPDTPDGPTDGITHEQYAFSTMAIDPENNPLYYNFSWGDGTYSDWIGPYNSGDEITGYHAWTWRAPFDVKVKTKDIYNAESDWSQIHAIVIHNSPPETPSQPEGPTQVASGESYYYNTFTTDRDGDSIKYQYEIRSLGGWPLYTSDWESFPPGWVASLYVTWSWVGDFALFTRAKEVFGGAESNWSEPLIVTVSNTPPTIPQKPDGPISGEPNIVYSFITSSTDPDSSVYYQWSWGDTVSDWIGPFNSGEIASATHKWTTEGTFAIQVRVKDNRDATSSWSATQIIQISQPSESALKIRYIFGGINTAGAIIENIGSGNASNVNWNISVVGGGSLNRINVFVNGTIDKIIPGNEARITTGATIRRGFAIVSITVNVGNLKKTAVGLVLGKYVIVLGLTS